MNNTNTEKKRGRPANPNKTKQILIDAATKKPVGRGRPTAGAKLLRVTVQQSVKPSTFDWNTTKYTNIEEFMVEGMPKIKNKVNVMVIPPDAPAVAAEVA